MAGLYLYKLDIYLIYIWYIFDVYLWSIFSWTQMNVRGELINWALPRYCDPDCIAIIQGNGLWKRKNSFIFRENHLFLAKTQQIFYSNLIFGYIKENFYLVHILWCILVQIALQAFGEKVYEREKAFWIHAFWREDLDTNWSLDICSLHLSLNEGMISMVL